ncbi:MAG TPA: carboxypeptidase regulatory-like domain-containing protein [Blastocatellia bacterium]|nr:carboxypeptidase regulatory-like domain-containing protein [Blastocatellia bacterium]
MFNKILKKAAGLGALAMVLAMNIYAQTTHIEGTVKMKGEDGIAKPVPDAVVDIYRTDVKGQWTVKTDKQGVYRRLGMPITGTFLVVVSGPGLTPTYINNIRLAQTNTVDLIVNPGDGSKLTLEQVQAQIAQQRAGGGQPSMSAADRAKLEAARKEQEAKAAENKALQANFNEARAHYNAGIDMVKTKNYQGALSEFEQAANVDVSKHEAFKELSFKANAQIAEAHYQVGADLFNQKNRAEAKPHFEKAIVAINKAIEVASTDTKPETQNELLVYYNILEKNASLLVEHFGVTGTLDAWVATLNKAEAIDTANKNKWVVKKANMYRFAGRTDEAVAAYKAVLAADPSNLDALYNLGLTLIASSEKAQIQEGANALGDFAKNAPATDGRVPAVKEALEAVKTAYNIEAEKPSKRRAKP